MLWNFSLCIQGNIILCSQQTVLTFIVCMIRILIWSSTILSYKFWIYFLVIQELLVLPITARYHKVSITRSTPLKSGQRYTAVSSPVMAGCSSNIRKAIYKYIHLLGHPVLPARVSFKICTSSCVCESCPASAHTYKAATTVTMQPMWVWNECLLQKWKHCKSLTIFVTKFGDEKNSQC